MIRRVSKLQDSSAQPRIRSNWFEENVAIRQPRRLSKFRKSLLLSVSFRTGHRSY